LKYNPYYITNNKASSHFGAFSNKCTKGKKLPLKSDTITYRFSFNGMEQDNEIKGDGNAYSTKFRELDTRLGKWLSKDPESKAKPWESPYTSMGNCPIWHNDPLGNIDDRANTNNKNAQAKLHKRMAEKKPSTPTRTPAPSPTPAPTPTPTGPNFRAPFDRSGIVLQGDVSLGGWGGFQAAGQVYGRSETDIDVTFDLKGVANQSTGMESSKALGGSIFAGFNFDLKNLADPNDYQKNIGPKKISIEPYLKCRAGLLVIDYNLSTNEVKVGVGAGYTYSQNEASINFGGGSCVLGIKEKTNIIQLTNDPILLMNK
jgi:RHS repeat-associated protein